MTFLEELTGNHKLPQSQPQKPRALLRGREAGPRRDKREPMASKRVPRKCMATPRKFNRYYKTKPESPSVAPAAVYELGPGAVRFDGCQIVVQTGIGTATSPSSPLCKCKPGCWIIPFWKQSQKITQFMFTSQQHMYFSCELIIKSSPTHSSFVEVCL